MTDLSPNITVTKLYVNGLNTPNKTEIDRVKK